MNHDQFYRGLMGREPVLVWPYLSQFVTHSTAFAHLEVFHTALLGYMFKIEEYQKYIFMTSSLLQSFVWLERSLGLFALSDSVCSELA